MPNSPTIDDSDEILAEALQSSNQEALSLLYDRYSSALFGVLQKITGDIDTAEEALQVCFVNIWQNKHFYNSSKERLFTWIFGIAKNAAAMVLEEKSGKVKNQDSKLSVSDANQGFGDGKNTKSATELLVLGSMSQEEAAEELGVSINELRIMLRKEINKLRGI